MTGRAAGPRRVLYVINDLRRAGAETQLVRLATALDRRRFEPSVCLIKSVNDFAADLDAAGVPVRPLGRRGPWDLHVIRRLHGLMDRERPDLVHAWLPFASLLALVAGRAARVPAIVISQRASHEATLPPLWRRIYRWSQRRADRVIVNSKAALREELAAGLLPARAVHIPNALGRREILPLADRGSLGLPPGPLVLALGQLSREKGHADLIDAWSTVHRGRPDATLALLGDGPLRGELEDRVARAGLGSSVLFLGFRHPAQPYLRAADLFVQASRTEGLPNSVLEAMAARRAVVATAVGGVPELVEDGTSGLLVPPGRPEALARALLELLGDPARLERFGAAGEALSGRFSLEGVVAAVEAVYESCLAPREPA